MKKVSAYIKPFRLEDVLRQLPTEGVLEVLLSDIRGYGQQKGQLELYSEHEFGLSFLPKARVEVYCEDEAAEVVAQAIRLAAKTGRIGDGKILLCTVGQYEPV